MGKLRFSPHTGPTGYGISDRFFIDLDMAGIPAFVKAEGGTAGVKQVNNILEGGSQIPHTAVWRNVENDVPNYSLMAYEASIENWNYHNGRFPPELNGSLVWRETINEPRYSTGWGTDTPTPEQAIEYTGWADWLGWVLYFNGLKALNEGVRFCGPGFATGNPEVDAWEQPGMIAFLGLCADYPDQVAVALHEYSLEEYDIFNGYPYLVGRFQFLFDVCDDHGIARPQVMITEWGWEYDNAPSWDQAKQEILSVGEIYAQHPEILGAGIWYLGEGWGDVNHDVFKYIEIFGDPLLQLIKDTEFAIVPSPQDCSGLPRTPYNRVYNVIPSDATEEQATAVFLKGWQRARETAGGSYDDALMGKVGDGGLTSITGNFYGIPDFAQDDYLAWRDEFYPCAQVEFKPMPGQAPPNYLQVIQYSQRDPQWAAVTLGQPTGHGGTIGRFGCLLTVYTSMADYLKLAADNPEEMNGRMVAAGAFGNQFILPGALQITFPDQVVYDGWEPGTDPLLRVTIANYLDQGVPVPAEVDFVPGDSDWDQHWVLIIGLAEPDDYWMMDPWTGAIGRISSAYDRPGVDLRQALFYRLEDISPPPQGDARIGLHASADPGNFHGGGAEFHEFQVLWPGIVKVLNAHSESSIIRLYHDVPQDCLWVIRLFLSFDGRTVSPQQFFEWTVNDTARALNALISSGADPDNIWIEIHNEPNLNAEGFDVNWFDGASFASWGTAVLSLYRSSPLPNVKYLYPGLSPGTPIPGIRYDPVQFLTDSQPMIDLCDGIGIHAYWADNDPIENALAWVDHHIAIPNKPLVVTEASRKGAPSPGVMADDYYVFWQALRVRTAVMGVTYFVASASNEVFWPECWIVDGKSRGIAETIAGHY